MWVAWGRILLTTYITPRPKKNYGSNINHHLCIGSSSGCQKKCQPSSITLGLQVQEFEKNRWFFAQKPTKSANRPISFNVFFLHHLIKLPPSPPQKKSCKAYLPQKPRNRMNPKRTCSLPMPWKFIPNFPASTSCMAIFLHTTSFLKAIYLW